jgi:hypothetical protein
MATMNDEVANVRNPREGVSENKYRVTLVKQSVSQKQQRTEQAQPPERNRDHYLFPPFRCVPLDEEAREKDGVAEPADDFPIVPLNPQHFAIVPKQFREPVHSSTDLTQPLEIQ